jgi:hypothetical protein
MTHHGKLIARLPIRWRRALLELSPVDTSRSWLLSTQGVQGPGVHHCRRQRDGQPPRKRKTRLAVSRKARPPMNESHGNHLNK